MTPIPPPDVIANALRRFEGLSGAVKRNRSDASLIDGCAAALVALGFPGVVLGGGVLIGDFVAKFGPGLSSYVDAGGISYFVGFLFGASATAMIVRRSVLLLGLCETLLYGYIASQLSIRSPDYPDPPPNWTLAIVVGVIFLFATVLNWKRHKAA